MKAWLAGGVHSLLVPHLFLTFLFLTTNRQQAHLPAAAPGPASSNLNMWIVLREGCNRPIPTTRSTIRSSVQLNNAHDRYSMMDWLIRHLHRTAWHGIALFWLEFVIADWFTVPAQLRMESGMLALFFQTPDSFIGLHDVCDDACPLSINNGRFFSLLLHSSDCGKHNIWCNDWHDYWEDRVMPQASGVRVLLVG